MQSVYRYIPLASIPHTEMANIAILLVDLAKKHGDFSLTVEMDNRFTPYLHVNGPGHAKIYSDIVTVLGYTAVLDFMREIVGYATGTICDNTFYVTEDVKVSRTPYDEDGYNSAYPNPDYPEQEDSPSISSPHLDAWQNERI